MAVQARVSPGPCLRMMTVLLPNRLEDHLDKECAASDTTTSSAPTMNKEPANDASMLSFGCAFNKWGVQHEMLNLFDSARQRPVAVDVAMRWGLRD